MHICNYQKNGLLSEQSWTTFYLYYHSALKSHKPTIITPSLHQKIIMFFQTTQQNLEKNHLLTLDLKFGLKSPYKQIEKAFEVKIRPA